MGLTLSLVSLLALVGGQAAPSGTRHLTFPLPDGGKMLYAISVPADYRPDQPLPLILALHPGGERPPYYGSGFARQIVGPALGDLHAIVVAPDCPTRTWAEEGSDQAVMALLQAVLKEYAIDRRRILITGFSMGGGGTWYLAGRHPDFFTAAIPMAGNLRNQQVDRLGTIPTYIIHSRDDEVVPFGLSDQAAKELIRLGRVVAFDALTGLGHYQMGGYVGPLRRAGRWVMDRWEGKPVPPASEAAPK